MGVLIKKFIQKLFFILFRVDYRIREIYIVQCSRKIFREHDCLIYSRIIINLIFEEDRRI